MGLKIFFDVDYTILAVDNSLRPGTRDTFEKLISDGHDVYIWSGVGLRNSDMDRLNLTEYISGIIDQECLLIAKNLSFLVINKS